MDIERYLGRIGYTGRRDATADTLRGLHCRHMLSVPFENLDIGRRPIVVNEAAFVRKVVEERRGGFCYELNGSFAALLRILGFDVELLSAGVARETGGFGPEYDHLALLVKADGEPWLADVGFGDSFIEPLRFEPGREQRDPAGTFRIASADDGSFLLEWRKRTDWEPQYRFFAAAHELDEFARRCDYHQTSPESSFTQKSVCSLALIDGRITLSGQRLITTRGGTREERELSQDEWRTALRDMFGVSLPF